MFVVKYEISPVPMRSAPTATSPATWPRPDRPGGQRGAGSLPCASWGCTHHAGVADPARAQQAQVVRRDASRPRPTSLGIGAALGAAFAGALGIISALGSCSGDEVRDDRPRRKRRPAPAAGSSTSMGRPSTGLPTKTEQADLLQAMFGRNGEVPPVPIEPSRPGVAGRLLRRRAEGGAHRDHLPRRRCCSVRRHARRRRAGGGSPDAAQPRHQRPTAPPPLEDGRHASTTLWSCGQSPRRGDLLGPWAIPGTAGL